MAYSLKYYPPEINDIVKELKGYINHDGTPLYLIDITFKKFTATLLKDTSWISLLSELDKKMNRSFKIENKFSPEYR